MFQSPSSLSHSQLGTYSLASKKVIHALQVPGDRFPENLPFSTKRSSVASLEDKVPYGTLSRCPGRSAWSIPA